MEEVYLKNIKKEIDDGNADSISESKSCLSLLDCGPIPNCSLKQDVPHVKPGRTLSTRRSKTKVETAELHVTVKDEPPEDCETEMLVVKPDILVSKPKKAACSSELRLVRKDMIVASKKLLAVSTGPAAAVTTQEMTSQSQQKQSLKEKVSCVSSLAQQLHEVSSQKVAMPCPYCSYTSSTESHLKKHLASHKESNMELYSCLVCPFTTIYKYQLKTHTDRHSFEIGKHLCRYCNFSTCEREELELHLKSHETYEVLVCHYCGYKSTHKASFNKHIRKHGRPCPVCNYITFDKADMERHCESHLMVAETPLNEIKKENTDGEGNIEFVCCGEDKSLKSCKDSGCEEKSTSTVQQEILLQPGRNIIDLTNCSKKWTIGKKFSSKNRYLCLLCNYSCRYKFSLRQHMVTHTGVGKLPCPYCKHESGNRSNLRKHVTAKHPGQSLVNFKRQAKEGNGHRDQL